MGILSLAPVKQLRETSDQKWSNVFKVCAVLLPVQLCCMPANENLGFETTKGIFEQA